MSYIKKSIRASYHFTIMVTPVQAVFGRDMIFNLVSVLDWKVVIAEKQRRVEIDNVQGNTRQFTHDYVIDNLVYV